jgi:hypothetical protein
LYEDNMNVLFCLIFSFFYVGWGSCLVFVYLGGDRPRLGVYHDCHVGSQLGLCGNDPILESWWCDTYIESNMVGTSSVHGYPSSDGHITIPKSDGSMESLKGKVTPCSKRDVPPKVSSIVFWTLFEKKPFKPCDRFIQCSGCPYVVPKLVMCSLITY